MEEARAPDRWKQHQSTATVEDIQAKEEEDGVPSANGQIAEPTDADDDNTLNAVMFTSLGSNLELTATATGKIGPWQKPTRAVEIPPAKTDGTR